jgi:hypothetical protein
VRVTIAEAALRLGISEPTARRRVRGGELPGTQVRTPQGFTWMVDLPDDLPSEPAPSGDMAVMQGFIDSMNSQFQLLKEQLEAKDKQIEQLHVLLQHSQAALAASKENHYSWWRRLWHRQT